MTAELDLQSFLWFGGEPGEPLSDITGMKTARHSKGNADGIKLERENHRIIPRNSFVKLGSTEEVLHRLFGAPP